MSRLDLLVSDVRTLRSMARGIRKSSGGSEADKLDRFYAPQAEHYDRFRERLLRGRKELFDELEWPDRAHVVELGGGTGRNIEYLGDRAATIARYDLVDLCAPLLDRARLRALRFPMLRVHHGDAADWQPRSKPDVVIFSYSLTMMPDWRAALSNAIAMLKPGGALAVVDFYVSSEQPAFGRQRHSAFDRWLWPRWFAHDGVRLDSEVLHSLCGWLPNHRVVESTSALPYLPMLRVPCYRFIGKTKPE